MFDPNEFLPNKLFEKFPELACEYRVITDFLPLDENQVVNMQTINGAKEKLMAMLMHSIIISQQNNWVLVTQVETYYHDSSIDDIAYVSKLDRFVDKLHISMQNFQEGRGTWYELRFSVGKFEVIATGGLCNNSNNDGLDAVLGVAVPPQLTNDDRFILFSPCEEVIRIQCYRMLRNYKKKASLYIWCSKSDFFCNLDFCTPLSLELHRTEPLGYVTVCSKLIDLSVSASLKVSEAHVLVDMLKQIQYWKDLGFEAEPTNEEIQEKLQLMKKNKISRKLSIAKRLIIDLLFGIEGNELAVSQEDLLLLYNGIVYLRIKAINKQRVQKIKKFINK